MVTLLNSCCALGSITVLSLLLTITIAVNEINDGTNKNITSTAVPATNPSVGPSDGPTEGPSAITDLPPDQSQRNTKKEIYNCAVLLPEKLPRGINNSLPYSYRRALPAIEIAVESDRVKKLVPNIAFNILPSDSHCDSVAAPLAAIDLMINRSVDVFIGPACDFSSASIARYTRHWNKAMLTAGAGAGSGAPFKNIYFFTRTQIIYDKLANAFVSLILDHFKWKRYSYLAYTNVYVDAYKECQFATASVHQLFKKRLHLEEYNDTTEIQKFTEWDGPDNHQIVESLKLISESARGKSNVKINLIDNSLAICVTKLYTQAIHFFLILVLNILYVIGLSNKFTL